MIAAVLAAVGAALCYGVATVLQAVAARRAPAAGFDVRLLVRLAGQATYVAGLGLDLAGFVLAIVALHTLPLFLVQSVVAGSVGVTAIVAAGLLGLRLSRIEVTSVALVAAGLVLLAVSAKPGVASSLSRSAQWTLLAALPVAALIASVAARRHATPAGVILAAVAGAGFGAVGIAARGLAVPHPWWDALTTPAVWAIAGFGVLAILAFATALQRASVTVAAAVMSSIETVVPAVVGLVVLHDRTRGGIGAPVAALGFGLALAGVLGLTRYANVDPAETNDLGQFDR